MNWYVFYSLKPSKFMIFVLLSCVVQGAKAQMLCSTLFEKSIHNSSPEVFAVQNSVVKKFETPQLKPYTSGLLANKLKAQNFKLDKEGILWDTRNSLMRKIGKIKVIETDKVYQWASFQYHQEIISSKGITKNWMSDILKAFGQVAGKGFYVSTHPFDSGMYGRTMTVFDVNRPIILLETGESPKGFASVIDTIHHDEFVQRALAAGIDGFRTYSYRQSWMAVINHEILSKPRPLKANDINSFLEYGIIASHQGYLKSAIAFLQDHLSEFDKNRVYYKLVSKQKLNPKEIAVLLKESESFLDSDRFQIYKELRRNLNEAKKIEDFLEVFKLLIKTGAVRSGAAEFINAVYPKSQQNNINLKMAVLDIFDLRTIAQLKKITDPNVRLKKLQEYFDAAKLYNDNVQIQFNTIKKVPDLMSFARKVFGDFNFKYRDFDVDMTFDNDGQVVELPLSESVYHRIKSNPELNVTLIKTEKNSDGQKIRHVQVTYANTEQIINRFNLGPDAKNWPQRKIISEATKKLLAAIINPFENRHLVNDFPREIFDIYKLFLSLQPFEEGNGRFSRLIYLFYENSHNRARVNSGLALPVYDLDLFLDDAEYQQQIQIGAMMKAWVTASTTPEIFIERSQSALNFLKDLYPHLSSLME